MINLKLKVFYLILKINAFGYLKKSIFEKTDHLKNALSTFFLSKARIKISFSKEIEHFGATHATHTFSLSLSEQKKNFLREKKV